MAEKQNRKRKGRASSSLPPDGGRGEDPGRGFYSRVLDEAERLDFDIASGVDGIDDEITLMRVKIKSLLTEDPVDTRLLVAVTSMLAKLVKTRYSMNPKEEKHLGEAIKNIIRDIGVPLGLEVLGKG